uniref:Uncharacterized protein n=1 Tax=Chromera velia CCMP2878 TaxID=1169474 RepID=A0A0G4I4F2_9ALVE|eukprot:Cvel_10877.t1-p1 / transcript=Cvel_10877.t1 / gene=Cvel_10877 / organism=Chromera_velia_CCMP2878 / gene_product=hypothetical protein / transcript_product=hypothetical protein / location=Cvel_scaffold666:63531-66708(+) / protein_length=189 / sequence_SO=supercontig / SO=protein_coding / is_pseudo=false
MAECASGSEDSRRDFWIWTKEKRPLPTLLQRGTALKMLLTAKTPSGLLACWIRTSVRSRVEMTVDLQNGRDSYQNSLQSAVWTFTVTFTLMLLSGQGHSVSHAVIHWEFPPQAPLADALYTSEDGVIWEKKVSVQSNPLNVTSDDLDARVETASSTKAPINSRATRERGDTQRTQRASKAPASPCREKM